MPKIKPAIAEPGEFEKITSIDRTAVVHFSPPATEIDGLTNAR